MPDTPVSPDGAVPAESNRWLVLAICCTSLFVVGLDTSGLNLALPSIGADFHASASTLQWIIDAYTLVIAGLLMLSGSVADRVGRRLVFRIGLATFGLGSVLCGLAGSGETLVAARIVQAVGGSMLNPVAMSIITNTFRDPRERARAIGFWGGTVGLSMALGPLIGGVLVETVGWRAVFFMNVPVVLVALLLTTRYVAESRAEQPRSFDPAGQALVMVALSSLTYAIIEGRSDGWTSATVLGCGALALAASAGFVAVERRVTEPLVDLRFFASWPFSGAVVSAVLGFAAMAGFLFLNTLYLQTVRGYSPIHAGLATLPMAGLTAVFAPVSGRLVGEYGPRRSMVAAGAGIAASAAVLLLVFDPATPLWQLLVAYALFGAGFGMLNAPITTAAVSGMPRSRAGVASGIASSSRQVGSALGIAVFGSVAFSRVGPGRDLATAMHAAWWVMLGCGLGLLAVAFLVTGAGARRSAERVRELVER